MLNASDELSISAIDLMAERVTGYRITAITPSLVQREINRLIEQAETEGRDAVFRNPARQGNLYISTGFIRHDTTES